MEIGAKFYQYQPLAKRDTIRILALDPGQQDDPLTGTLEPAPIDSPGSYEALSYVWADPGPPGVASYEILIRDCSSSSSSSSSSNNSIDRDATTRPNNNHGLLVLRGGSVFAALRRLRLRDRPRRIWADQCCINQDDPVERSQQVHFMNRIYVSAAHVVVWLGPDTQGQAASAFSVVHELDQVLGGNGGGEDGAPPPDTSTLERHVRENQKALQALADRAWFKRGWIVQEIGTSAPATLLWGGDDDDEMVSAIDWDTLARVCERLKRYHYLRSSLRIPSSNISYLHRRFIEPDEATHHANRFNFVYELQRARHLRFSDDRDRVFAFLGHFSTQSRHPLGCGGPLADVLAADYTRTVQHTYVDVAVRILTANPEAACILLGAVLHSVGSLPGRGGSSSSGDGHAEMERWIYDEQRLPSWVPDWRSTSDTIILTEPICPHRAHGEWEANLEIVQGYRPDMPLLRMPGLEIDSVEICSGVLLASDFYVSKKGFSGKQEQRTMIERLWHDICGRGPFNLEDKYLNGGPQSAFFAFMQTLSNGCVQAAGHACRPYHKVSDDVWLGKAARYIVETLDVESTGDGDTGDTMLSADVRRAARELGEVPEGGHDDWSRWATSASDGRVIARSKAGYYVLGPAALEPGDVVCVLFGCKVPFCLRPIGGGRYLLVGECYVHGMMKGEGLEMLARKELDEKMFELV